MSRFNKGFTLIELLVVIAIIGILSSVVLASLNTARAKGRTASAQASLKSIQAASILCEDAGYETLDPSAGAGGGNVCSNTVGTDAIYPALPAGWTYDVTAMPGAGATPGVIDFIIEADGDSRTINCGDSTCTTT